MKYLVTILMIAAFAGAAMAQEETKAATPATPATPAAEAVRATYAADAKIYTELLASSEKVVKGAPFTAEVVNESVQTLADGNRIIRNSSSKMYRDSEGRFRRDSQASSGTGMQGLYVGVSNTTITDPVSGTKYFLNEKNKTFRKWAIKPPVELRALELKAEEMEKLRAKLKEAGADLKLKGQAMADLEKSLAAQGKAMTIVTTPGAQTVAAQADLEKTLVGKIAVAAPLGHGEMTMFREGQKSSYASNTETLGTRNVEGVEAEGSRTVTTIPAGAIGNERPIEIVYEKWYSKDLQLIVYSKHSDPRYGDQVYRLTNISRSEPDPSVFVVPGDYKAQAEGYAPAARSIYRVADGVPSVATTVTVAPSVTVTPIVNVKTVVAPKKPQ